MCVICDFRHSSGVPEADAVSRKWTDEYLEANMKDRPSTVMKSGEAKPLFFFFLLVEVCEPGWLLWHILRRPCARGTHSFKRVLWVLL